MSASPGVRLTRQESSMRPPLHPAGRILVAADPAQLSGKRALQRNVTRHQNGAVGRVKARAARYCRRPGQLDRPSRH